MLAVVLPALCFEPVHGQYPLGQEAVMIWLARQSSGHGCETGVAVGQEAVEGLPTVDDGSNEKPVFAGTLFGLGEQRLGQSVYCYLGQWE